VVTFPVVVTFLEAAFQAVVTSQEAAFQAVVTSQEAACQAGANPAFYSFAPILGILHVLHSNMPE
jgi:hypothetical protein